MTLIKHEIVTVFDSYTKHFSREVMSKTVHNILDV